MSAKGTTWKKDKVIESATFPESAINLIASLKGEIDLLRDREKKLKEQVRVLREAIKGVLRNVNGNGDIHMMQGGKLQYELNAALSQTETKD